MRETPVETLERVTIRFAGDSGDGMQLTGMQFTSTTAIVGNDLATLPDFPAEIRAPAGSLPGVSGFQVSFSSQEIHTPGDTPDVLVAMNPAALKVNLPDMPRGSTIIVNEDAFAPQNLRKANYGSNPLLDGSLSAYRVHRIPISTLNGRALEGLKLDVRQGDRCKNFFALGIMYWLYDRPLEPTLKWIREKFAKNPDLAAANTAALRAGLNYGETTEIFTTHYRVRRAELPPGEYRNITGNEAAAIGFIAASRLAGLPLFYGSYPITPASDILHELSRRKAFGVRTFQAEDEIAAIGASIGASFGGCLGLTGTSGPGLALKSEALGLAVALELPLVVAVIQRAGPSTGMPTKNEQADLLQAMFGRNGECPVGIVAPATPADCFTMAIEAARLAIRYRTPVVYLSDGYLGNGAEPWRIPREEDLPRIDPGFWTDPEGFAPYRRDPATLARPWAVPGTPGLEHRIGGIEKQDITGNVSYDPWNHFRMVRLRAEKVERMARDIAPLEVLGPAEGDVLVVGWGGTYGAITSAVRRAVARGEKVSQVHLRHLNPFPADLGGILKRFRRVVVPELNLGQLALLLRARYLVDAIPFSKVTGRPFRISEIEEAISAVRRGERPELRPPEGQGSDGSDAVG